MPTQLHRVMVQLADEQFKFVDTEKKRLSRKLNRYMSHSKVLSLALEQYRERVKAQRKKKGA